LFAAKHFPGHGSVTEDSHTTLPVSDATIDELLRADLVPFKELMSLTNSAIMTSHVVFRKLDPDRPTPLSPVLVEEFLRGELGFDGVVITDCLEMSGIRKIGPVPEVAVMAVEAGCDLVLISHTPKLQEAAFWLFAKQSAQEGSALTGSNNQLRGLSDGRRPDSL